jgi:hypothetical protein
VISSLILIAVERSFGFIPTLLFQTVPFFVRTECAVAVIAVNACRAP